MAIQSIDLQTMFGQLEKVGKIQAVQREGFAIQQALQGIQIQKKVEEQLQSINETQNTGEGATGVHDRHARKQPGEDSAKHQEAEGNAEKQGTEKRPVSIVRDPALGKNIDING
ncbi:MAG: hypothetical protein LBQ30_04685 [Treponema sp.]|jgi:hypothetical protein|nr:hypothetical protein [Treponema sp.]